MPTASVGAPPAVQHRRFADVGGGLQDLFRADDEAPGADRRRRMHGHVLQRSHDHRRVFGAQAVQVRHGDAQRRRRVFMAKYRPGSMMEAATSAMMATKDSISIAP